MAGREGSGEQDAARPRPPPGPRPRGNKKEKTDANEPSPRKAEREKREGRNKSESGVEGEKSPKKGARHSHRRSKEKGVTSDNWRQYLEQFIATNNGDAFSQHSRGSLHLCFTPLTADDIGIFSKAFSANIPLRSLGFSNCQISDDQCCKLMAALSKNTHIKRLDLSWNPISESSAAIILEFAKAHPNLDEINLLGTSLTQESQQRVLSSYGNKSPKESPPADMPRPRPILNTVHLNELALTHFDNSNIEQAFKQLRLSNDEHKYLILTLADRLSAAGKHEKVLDVLLAGHRAFPSDLSILYRLCCIYWQLGNSQPKAAREMYFSVGLTFAERGLLVEEKSTHHAFEKWLRDFSTGLTFSAYTPASPRAPSNTVSAPSSPATSAALSDGASMLSQSMRLDKPAQAAPAPSSSSPRPLATSMVLAKKEKKNKSRDGLNELARGEKLERKRSYTTENIPTMFARDTSAPVISHKAPVTLHRDFPKSDTALPRNSQDYRAENQELRSQLALLYEEVSRLKKKERTTEMEKSSSSRESPTTSAPASPHPMAELPPQLATVSSSKMLKKEEELDQRIAFQIAQLSALNVQLQNVTMRLDATRKQVSAMKEEERTLQQTISRLNRKEQKIEAQRAKQQGVIGKSVWKLNLTNVIINEALSRGRGGSGATVHACTVDGWSCACKELDIAELPGDGEEGFMQEVTLLERLPFHPNIVKYLFHERVGQRVRLFMTRYHSNLTDFMATRTTGFTAANITKYALDVLSGLEFLHKHQVLHRDLKSDNVFVLLNDKKEIHQLAIGDFDVAKRLKLERPTKSVVGTPYIMAPEVLMRQDYSFPSDVFSYGMVLFELMAMKRPYEGRLFEVPDLKLPTPILSDASYSHLVRAHRSCLRQKASERPSLEDLRSMLHS